MVSIQQVQQGLIRYIDTDILPHLTGFKKVGLGVYVALASDRVSSMILNAKDHPAISVTGVIDELGNVDIDRIYNAVLPMVQNGEKIPIDIPMIGEIRIDSTDVEKLYRYIKG